VRRRRVYRPNPDSFLVNEMKHLALAVALACGCALAAPVTPAAAAATADESSEAIIAAAQAAEAARRDMRSAFDRASPENGQFLWKKSHEGSAVSRVVIDLTGQLAYAYDGDELVAVSTISSGVEEHPSPIGIFPILEKRRHYRSIKYDNAPMPFMQRIDDYGIALHAGQLPGRPASHGCIRLPREFAAKLFAATRIGTPVLMGKPAILADLRKQGHDV
jgi:lipoprotein-anchoring transpeptidase ErfK/SrfK